jgi:hypothetical protein
MIEKKVTQRPYNMRNLDFKTLLILALVVVVVLMKMFSGKPTEKNDIIKIDGRKYEVLKREIDTEYVEHIKTVTKPGKDIVHDTTIYVPIPTYEPIDTEAILRNYYAKNIFKDTLKLDDSLGYISVTDTISQNKIFSRKWDSKIFERKITDKLIVKDYRTQLYFGGIMGFDKVNVVNFAGPSMLLKTKKDNIYSLGIGYSNAKTVSVQGGIYWKIKLKK